MCPIPRWQWDFPQHLYLPMVLLISTFRGAQLPKQARLRVSDGSVYITGLDEGTHIICMDRQSGFKSIQRDLYRAFPISVIFR
jgi:hypothetical protein